MHCANLDTLVKGPNPLHHSLQQTAQLAKNIETKEEEDTKMLKMVLDAGILVLEGRIPDRTSKRGYVEGPHCVLYPHTQTHRCDFNNYMCKRMEMYRKLMQSIWKEYKALCIELRVCAECNCGEEQVWKKTTTRFDYVLEQWYFEITNVRNDDDDIGVMNWYGLLQAIRSQIHFSQLSAWWSSNRATLPKNITYRVLPLSQVDINDCQLQHKFPVLMFSTAYLQVKVRSQPRSEVLPKIQCPVHCNQDNVLDDRMRIRCDRFGKHHCQALDDVDENYNGRRSGIHKEFCYENLKLKPDDDIIPNLEKSYKDKNTSRKAFRKISINDAHDEDFLNMQSLDDSRNTQFLTSRRPSCSFGSTKNIVDRNWQHPQLENRSKFTVNAVSDSLNKDNNAQFFNVCNWTNTMVSNMVLKMRNSNSFLNDLSDSDSLSQLFLKMDKNSNTNCQCSNEKLDGESSKKYYSKSNKVTNINQNSGNFESENKIFNAVSVCSSNDSNSGINDKGDTKLIKTSFVNNNYTDMESKGDETKLWKWPSKSNAIFIRERNTEKLKNSNEKRRRFPKSQKHLLPFIGSFVESVLSGRVYFSRAIQNFKIKITFGGSFTAQNNCTDLPATTYYYHFGDGELCKSYLVKGFIPENEKGIQIPAQSRLQVSIFNTEECLIKVFVIPLDLSDMPRCSKTYVRHSNYYIPKSSTRYNVKWLQSFLQLKCSCSKSGRFYLQKEINAIIFQKSDVNTACEFKMKTDLIHQDITEIEYK